MSIRRCATPCTISSVSLACLVLPRSPLVCVGSIRARIVSPGHCAMRRFLRRSRCAIIPAILTKVDFMPPLSSRPSHDERGSISTPRRARYGPTTAAALLRLPQRFVRPSQQRPRVLAVALHSAGDTNRQCHFALHGLLRIVTVPALGQREAPIRQADRSFRRRHVVHAV